MASREGAAAGGAARDCRGRRPAGTSFENTIVPLRAWFKVAFLMLSSKKGVSALQVHRMIDPVRGAEGSYKTAWYMCMRIRAAMQDGEFLGGLAGEIEVDETYI